MRSKSFFQHGFIRATRFGTLIALALWPVSGSAQSDIQTDFTSILEQKLEARPGPAKITTAEESALTGTGHVKIGTIKGWRRGTSGRTEVAEALRAAILEKGAEVGGDLVHFDKDAAVDRMDVPTGKMEKVCLASHQVRQDRGSYIDIHGDYHPPDIHFVDVCDSWGTQPKTKMEKSLLSEGSVWRYDPKLSAALGLHFQNRKEAFEWMHSAFPESSTISEKQNQQTRELNFVGDPPSCTITIVDRWPEHGKHEIRDIIIDLSLIDPDSIKWYWLDFMKEYKVDLKTTNGKKVITLKSETENTEPVLMDSDDFSFSGPEYAERFANAFKEAVSLCGGKVSTTVPEKSPTP